MLALQPFCCYVGSCSEVASVPGVLLPTPDSPLSNLYMFLRIHTNLSPVMASWARHGVFDFWVTIYSILLPASQEIHHTLYCVGHICQCYEQCDSSHGKKETRHFGLVYGFQNSGKLHTASPLIAEVSYKHEGIPHNNILMRRSHHHKDLKQGCCPTIIIMQDTTTNPCKRDKPGAVQKLMVASWLCFPPTSRSLPVSLFPPTARMAGSPFASTRT
jgi:hypothetical protein